MLAEGDWQPAQQSKQLCLPACQPTAAGHTHHRRPRTAGPRLARLPLLLVMLGRRLLPCCCLLRRCALRRMSHRQLRLIFQLLVFRYVCELNLQRLSLHLHLPSSRRGDWCMV